MCNAIYSPSNMAEVKEKIRKAILKFAERDWRDLMKSDIYEPTISHRIAVYLENEFPGYNVDCEYNKNLEGYKKNTRGKKIRPDIIVHKRNSLHYNLCIFEVKKSGIGSLVSKKDQDKIRDILKNPNLHYRLGVFVSVLKSKITVVWFENNKEEIEILCELSRQDGVMTCD